MDRRKPLRLKEKVIVWTPPCNLVSGVIALLPDSLGGTGGLLYEVDTEDGEVKVAAPDQIFRASESALLLEAMDKQLDLIRTMRTWVEKNGLTV